MKTYTPDNAATISDMIQRSCEAGHTPLQGRTNAERRENFFRDLGLDANGKPLKEEFGAHHSVHFIR